MQILQVTTSARRRGAEVFAAQIGDHLRAAGNDVHTSCLEPGGSLPFEPLGHARRDPRTWLRLAARARASDVTVAHGGSTLAPVALCSTAARTPFVYRNIGDPSHWGRTRGAGLRVGTPLRRASAVVALYEDSARYMVERYRLDARRVSVIPNAVDADLFPERTARSRSDARQRLGVEGPVLGYLGNLSAEKRPGWALDTAEAMGESTLLVAGAGPLDEALQDRADHVHSVGGPRIRFLGQVPDPAGFLEALDVLLLPSETEGIPAALLEAALVGVPAVATDVGGVASAMAVVGAGKLVPAQDRSGFVDATRSILEDPAGAVPRRDAVVAKYALAAVAADWERVLQSALHG